MISVKSSGDFKDTTSFLKYMQKGGPFKDLDPYGRAGTNALSSATPRDTGRAADSWGYQTGYTNGVYAISWWNTDIEGGCNVAVLIQYGHGTGTGGYVPGIDYINPAMRPVFDKTVNDIWKKVTNG
ncbi:MAG: HK97 gp10 family phage protein [Paenisporosarcina sp.]